MSAFCSLFFFFNDTATTEIYTLSLHDALPISHSGGGADPHLRTRQTRRRRTCTHEHDQPIAGSQTARAKAARSEEHTSELQSRLHLVCRLLLEKKKTRRHLRTRT